MYLLLELEGHEFYVVVYSWIKNCNQFQFRTSERKKIEKENQRYTHFKAPLYPPPWYDNSSCGSVRSKGASEL